MTDLVRASRFVRLHRGKIIVIKVGGSCLTRPSLRRALARQIAVVEACGAKPIVVHGGGPQTDELQRSFGEEPRLVEGRRVTSPVALRALCQATSQLNGELIEAITAEGASAVSLSGSDCAVADRRPPMVTTEGVVDFGEVGDVRVVDPEPIQALHEAGHVPVVSPPASDGGGGFLNVNADLLAAHVACAMNADKLVLCTNAAGVLGSASDSSSVLSTLTTEQLSDLERDGSLQKGMRVKAVAIKMALEGGVARAHVVSGIEPDGLLGELYTTQGTGTLITIEPEAAPESAELEVSP